MLRLAIVEASINSTACNFLTTPTPSFSSEGEDQHVRALNAMRLSCEILLKSGGANRVVGLDKVRLGNVGNLTSDNFTVQYPVPNPTPPPPGNQAGTQYEAPNGRGVTNPSLYFPLPMVDTRRGSENDGGPSGGLSAFRFNSNDSTTSSPSGGGRLVTVTSVDVPVWEWDQFNQSTGNTWETTTGTVQWREYILGYTETFPKAYAGIAKGDWRVVLTGTSDLGEWTAGAGASIGVVNAISSLILTGGSPTDGDTTGVQVLGLSFAWRNEMETTP